MTINCLVAEYYKFAVKVGTLRIKQGLYSLPNLDQTGST